MSRNEEELNRAFQDELILGESQVRINIHRGNYEPQYQRLYPIGSGRVHWSGTGGALDNFIWEETFNQLPNFLTSEAARPVNSPEQYQWEVPRNNIYNSPSRNPTLLMSEEGLAQFNEAMRREADRLGLNVEIPRGSGIMEQIENHNINNYWHRLPERGGINNNYVGGADPIENNNKKQNTKMSDDLSAIAPNSELQKPVEPILVSVTGLIEDLKNGLTRCKGDTGYNEKIGSIEEKYVGLTKTDIAEIFKHPKLKGLKVKTVKEATFTLVDDTEVASEDNAFGKMSAATKKEIEAAKAENEAEKVGSNDIIPQVSETSNEVSIETQDIPF